MSQFCSHVITSRGDSPVGVTVRVGPAWKTSIRSHWTANIKHVIMYPGVANMRQVTELTPMIISEMCVVSVEARIQCSCCILTATAGSHSNSVVASCRDIWLIV